MKSLTAYGATSPASWLRIAALAVLCLVPSTARAFPLDEYAKQWAEQADLSASWRLQRGSEVLAEGSRGFVRGGSGQPIAADSVFWIGSVTKQFAAVAVLELVEQGKLELDAKLTRYFPELRQGALSRNGVDCSVEHVLSHRCGLPRDPSNALAVTRHLSDPERAARLLAEVERATLGFDPGSKYEYSNLGYGLIGLLVQRASGRGFEQYLQDEFWGPLGMDHTGIRLRDGLVLVRGQTGALFTWVDAGDWMFFDPEAIQDRGAEGNIYSTPRDLSVWTQALHHGKILQPASYAELTRPRLGDYGLGLSITDEAIGKLIHHDGALAPQGYSSQVAYMPEYDLSVVVLTNRPLESAQALPFAGALLRKASGQPDKPPSADPGKLRLLGSFSFVWLVIFVPLMLGMLIRRVRQPERLDRESWWLSYHSYALALGIQLFYFRPNPFEPLMLAWVLLLFAGAYKSRWWQLPRWRRRSGIRPYLSLVLRSLVLLALVWFATQPILVLFGVLCIAQAGLPLLGAARTTRATALPR